MPREREKCDTYVLRATSDYFLLGYARNRLKVGQRPTMRQVKGAGSNVKFVGRNFIRKRP